MDTRPPVALGTVQDAARILNCSPDRVRQLERLGELSATRTRGGIRLFNLSEVERLAARRLAPR
jgi:excisionase family DNA binding protein